MDDDLMPDASPAGRMRAMLANDRTGREMPPADSNSWIPGMVGDALRPIGDAIDPMMQSLGGAAQSAGESLSALPNLPGGVGGPGGLYHNAPQVMGQHLQDMGQMVSEGAWWEKALGVLGGLGTPAEPFFQNFIGTPVEQSFLAGGADPRTAEIASAVGQMGAGFMVPSMLATAPSKGGKVANALDEAGMVNFHGTPHVLKAEPNFPNGRFRLDKIGTGEGAQAYGWGIYTADSKDVAGTYQRELAQRAGATDEWFFRPTDDAASKEFSDAISVADAAPMLLSQVVADLPDQSLQSVVKAARENAKAAKPEYAAAYNKMADMLEDGRLSLDVPEGSLYTLDLPDEDVARYLDWDAPLSEQPESVREALGLVVDSDGRVKMPNGERHYADRLTGEQIYKTFTEGKLSKAAASEHLASIGIPGLKYFDQGSRSAGKGTRNYVTWDQDVLDRAALLERNGEKLRSAADDLPMDEASRMARAREMGLDVPAFHETSGGKAESLDAFDIMKGGAGSGDELMPHGVFTKPTPDGIGLGGDDAAQMPLRINPGRVKVFQDRDQLSSFLKQDKEYLEMADELGGVTRKYKDMFEKEFAEFGRNRPRLSRDKIDVILEEWKEAEAGLRARMRNKATEIFKSEGYDSINVIHDSGSFGRKVNTTVVLDPKNIRSKFAKFDPSKKDSANILAGGALGAVALPYFAQDER